MDRRSCLKAMIGTGVALIGHVPSWAARPAPPALSLKTVRTVVSGLHRPEGIAVTRDGKLILSNEESAVAIFDTPGGLRHVGTPIAPCGIAIDPQGRIIIANMGLLTGRPGQLQRLDLQSEKIETLVSELDGRALVASNNPAVASDGTIYCTHSNWGNVRNIGKVAAEGFVYSVAPDGTARIVARDLRGANGCCLGPDERHLYISCTAEGRVKRYLRRDDGTLGDVEDFGPVLGVVVPDHMSDDIRKLGARDRAALGYCDGMAFDRDGNLWITLPFANHIVALTPDGKKHDIIHDPDGKLINMPTNIAWGGADRRDLFIVARGSGAIVQCRTPVAGLRLPNQR
jgi:gluconolactonase